MRFVTLYRNRPDVRENVESFLLAHHKKVNFSQQPVQTPFLQTRLYWPSPSEILSLPFTTQCEEVEIKDGKLVSLHVSIIDVEAEVVAPPPSPPAKA